MNASPLPWGPPMPNPLDLELCVRVQDDTRYLVESQSAAGEASGTTQLPFGERDLAEQLQSVRYALLSSVTVRRRLQSTDERTVQDFGQILFETIFTPDIRPAYEVSRMQAAQQNRPLRVLLRIDAPQLASLPWEFMYDPHAGDFLCLSRNTPIVRYLDVQQAVRPLTVEAPLRILGVVASPSDLPRLNVDGERQRLEAAVGDLVERGIIELHWLDTPTMRALQREMRAGPWHLFHFVGHAGFDEARDEGVVALESDTGRSDRVSATNLGRTLGDHLPLRLAVLNACEGARSSTGDLYSSTAAQIVRKGTPAVLAMQYEISDDGAIEFARAFYESIADGTPVDTATADARQAISNSMSQSLEWGIPVLYTHAPDGVLFDVTPPKHLPPPKDLPPPPPKDSPPPPPPSRQRQWKLYAMVGVLALIVVAVVAWLALRPAHHDQLSGHSVSTFTKAGGSVHLTDRALDASVAANNPNTRAGTRLTCTISGDYDLQVDYQLGSSFPGGAKLGLIASDTSVERSNDGGSKYFMNAPNNQQSQRGTQDTQGELRLTRTGDQLTAFARPDAGVDWSPVGQARVSTDDTNVTLQVWGTTQAPASATFTNFGVTPNSC